MKRKLQVAGLMLTIVVALAACSSNPKSSGTTTYEHYSGLHDDRDHTYDVGTDHLDHQGGPDDDDHPEHGTDQQRSCDHHRLGLPRQSNSRVTRELREQG